MKNINLEYIKLTWIAIIAYFLAVLVGIGGAFFEHASYPQLLCYQINDALGITASVIASRYLGLRGLHVAASAFILMGITHGVSMSSSGMDSFNIERGIVIIMPMIPALLLLFWCWIFPLWLRLLALVPISLFAYNHIEVVKGGAYYSTSHLAAYLSLMVLEILWSYYIYLDVKKVLANE